MTDRDIGVPGATNPKHESTKSQILNRLRNANVRMSQTAVVIWLRQPQDPLCLCASVMP